jgi:NAD(P)-dependent dehydrogenase (short-subunit alcohol dehydrogenase family)
MEDSLFSVKDKVIIITGASSGLGCHFAKTLATAGAKVILGARRVDKLEKIANEISKASGVASIDYLDVTQAASIQLFVKNVQRQFGYIDVLINNAGIDARKTLLQTTEVDWSPVIDTNMKGTVLMTQAVATHMMAQKSGSMINISSVSDTLAFETGNPAYLMSKAGISHFTHLVALALAGANVRANAIAPGIFHTEINDDLFDTDLSKTLQSKIPLSRFGDLNDLNGALLLLCSDASRYITGTIVRVDGGLGINKLM